MSRTEQVTLQIEDMSCGHCVHAVSTALEAHPGVKVEDVKLGEATVPGLAPCVLMSRTSSSPPAT